VIVRVVRVSETIVIEIVIKIGAIITLIIEVILIIGTVLRVNIRRKNIKDIPLERLDLVYILLVVYFILILIFIVITLKIYNLFSLYIIYLRKIILSK